MGQQTKPRSYRDDPDAVSMHTTPDNYEYPSGPSADGEGDDTGPGARNDSSLPSYTDSENLANTERDNQGRANRVNDHYSMLSLCSNNTNNGWRYSTPRQRIAPTNEISARMDARLSDPDELFNYINNGLQHLPPVPRVHVLGSHNQTVRRDNKKETEIITDFYFSLNLGLYLGRAQDAEWRLPRVITNGEKAHRGSWRKTRAPGATQDIEVGGPAERDLKAWVHDYCANQSKLKIFRVARTVTGIDEAYLKNAIEQALRRTDYRGRVDVAVHVEDRAVDIYSDHWINRWRNGWQRWLFYLTFLWIFTWPVLYFMTKRWAVFVVDWPFSVAWPDRGQGARRFATISEEAWLRRHDNLIRRLAVDGYQGDATGMPLEGPEPRSRSRRMPSTGSRNVDSAVSFVQGGVGVWNALQGRGGGGDLDGWGGDC